MLDADSLMSAAVARRQGLPGKSGTMTLRFGEQLHLVPQLLQLGSQAPALASPSNIAHPLMELCGGRVAFKEVVHAVEVLRPTDQVLAADAECSCRPANAEAGVTAMAERDREEAAVALEHFASARVGFSYQSLEALRLLLGIDQAQRKTSIVHHGQHALVSDHRLFRRRHLAVVPGRFGRLSITRQRVP